MADEVFKRFYFWIVFHLIDEKYFNYICLTKGLPLLLVCD